MSCLDFKIIDHNFVFQSNVKLTASSASSAFPVSNLRQFFRSKVWRTTGIASEWLEIDLQTEEEIDAFALIWDNAQSIKFSGAARFWIQANATPVWTAPAIDQEIFIDGDLAVAVKFWETDQSFRYWRLKIEDPLNYLGYLEIPKVFLGRKIQMTRIPSIGFQLAMIDQSKRERTDYGQEYVDVFPVKRRMSFALGLCDAADVKILWNSFQRVGTTHPVLVVMDGQGTVYDTERMTLYGRYASDLVSKHIIRDIMSQDIEIEELF